VEHIILFAVPSTNHSSLCASHFKGRFTAAPLGEEMLLSVKWQHHGKAKHVHGIWFVQVTEIYLHGRAGQMWRY